MFKTVSFIQNKIMSSGLLSGYPTPSFEVNSDGSYSEFLDQARIRQSLIRIHHESYDPRFTEPIGQWLSQLLDYMFVSLGSEEEILKRTLFGSRSLYTSFPFT